MESGFPAPMSLVNPPDLRSTKSHDEERIRWRGRMTHSRPGPSIVLTVSTQQILSIRKCAITLPGYLLDPFGTFLTPVIWPSFEPFGHQLSINGFCQRRMLSLFCNFFCRLQGSNVLQSNRSGPSGAVEKKELQKT